MLTYNRKVITHNDKWFNEFIGHPEQVYHVYTSGQGGQVVATPNSGVYGTYVTLSNTPSLGYEFVNYSITGAPWYNRESFYIQHNDAYVEGNFNAIVRTVTCSGDHGTVVASPNSGIIGDTITLSNTPDEGYALNSYTITGATLYDTNKFNIATSNVHVQGNFTVDTQDVTIGTQTWMGKDLMIDDGQGGIIKVNNVTAHGVNMGTVYYYTWDAAKRIANSISGWHLPTRSEWTSFLNYIKNTNDYSLTIRSTTAWDVNGNNATGFNAYPIGYKSTAGGLIDLLGDGVQYWSSTSPESGRAYAYIILAGTPSNWPIEYSDYANEYYPVRLIKDS